MRVGSNTLQRPQSEMHTQKYLSRINYAGALGTNLSVPHFRKHTSSLSRSGIWIYTRGRKLSWTSRMCTRKSSP